MAEIQKRGLTLPKSDRIEPQCPEWAHVGQRGWYESGSVTNIGLAGAQGGKTAMLPHLLLKRMVDAAPLAVKLGRGDALYIGPTLELLGAQAIPAFRRLWEEDLRLGRMVMGGKPKFYISKAGGMRLWGAPIEGTVHCAYANDSSNLESLTAIAAAWDEAGQKENKEASYEAVLRRLSIARSHGYGHLDIGTTPYEWGWLKRRVVDIADGEKIRVHNWPSWMNPWFDRQVAEDAKEGMPPWRWQMMYEGRYTRPAGIVYDCFGPETLCDPFEVPMEWPLWIGVDFGLINTAAVIVAQKMSKDWRGHWDKLLDEYFLIGTYHAGEQATAKEHLRAMRDMCDVAVEGGRSQKPVAYGGSHQESGWRESYALSGVGINEPPVSSVESQIACLYAGFKTGKLKVFRTATKFIEEAETFSYELDEQGMPTQKLADEAKYHRLAGARYLASKLFRAAERTRVPKMGYAA